MIPECEEEKSGKAKMKDSDVCDCARNVLKYCGVNDEKEIDKIIQEMEHYRKCESLHKTVTIILHNKCCACNFRFG